VRGHARTRHGPLAVLLLAWLLGGCSAGPEKQPAAASTPTASQAAAEHADGTVRNTTTARPSAKPEVLDPKVAAEAQAFVRDFMAASDRATASGDFAEVKRLVAAGCEPCQASIAYFTKLYAGGGTDYPAERVTYSYTVRKTNAGWQVVDRSF
jgi:hypothetical protein